MSEHLTDIAGYEVEIEKMGRARSVQLIIGTVKGLRGRRKLIGEATMSDVTAPIIHFQIKHAETVEVLFDTFLRQLIHRGYMPLRARSRKVGAGAWLEWNNIDPSRFDLTDLGFTQNVDTREV
jgi:hypothetical protein